MILMKKIMIISLMLMVLLTAGQAFAALKVLPEDLQAELHQLAIEKVAQDLNISVDRIEVNESWVRELHNIGVELLHVNLLVDNNSSNYKKIFVVVDVATKEVYTEEKAEELIAEDMVNAPDEPVFRITTLQDGQTKADGEVHITGGVAPATKPSPMKYVVPALAIFALGGIGLKLKGRK
jgi:hypothetical protein